jgi:hypothetical protein
LAFGLESVRIEWQADAHEISREGLGEIFPVWRAQPQTLITSARASPNAVISATTSSDFCLQTWCSPAALVRRQELAFRI